MSEVRATCPECQSITLKGRVDPKFYYNTETQLGYCHHCGYRGKFGDSIMEELQIAEVRDAIVFNQKILEELEPLPSEALRYVKNRFPGAEQSELEAFSLRYSKGLHAIAIPSFGLDGQLQGIKYRYLASGDQRYGAETGSTFGGYWIEAKRNPDKLLIVEGEFDAISASLVGFSGAILALQTNKLSDQSKDRVRRFKNVFLCLDSDEAGTEGARSITSLLGNLEPVVVNLTNGAKDLNEFLQKEGLNETNRFLREATRTPIERDTFSLGSSLQDMVSFLSDIKNTRGTSSGYKKLDHDLGGGFRPSELTVINAFAKTGKTSFVNNLAHNLAVIGKKVAIASFEMDPARTIYPTLLSIAGQTNIRKINDRDTLQESVEMLSQECSYLNNVICLKRFGYTPWKEIEEWAIFAKAEYQCEFLFLDHAGFMVEKMTDAEENQQLAKEIKKLTNTLGIHIFIVVQAPKTKDGLSIQTAYGGLAWGMNADNFIILERDKDNESTLKVKLEAARYPGSNPSNEPTMLFYDKETCTLLE